MRLIAYQDCIAEDQGVAIVRIANELPEERVLAEMMREKILQEQEERINSNGSN